MLATKYRPKKFDDVLGQDLTVKILKRQVETDNFKHGYLFAGNSGTGKAQPLSSKVLTPSGYKRMGDIKVGDVVVDGEGKLARVLGVFPQGKRDIYKIYFNDNTFIEVADNHLNSVYYWEHYSQTEAKSVDNVKAKIISMRHEAVLDTLELFKIVKDETYRSGYATKLNVLTPTLEFQLTAEDSLYIREIYAKSAYRNHAHDPWQYISSEDSFAVVLAGRQTFLGNFISPEDIKIDFEGNLNYVEKDSIQQDLELSKFKSYIDYLERLSKEVNYYNIQEGSIYLKMDAKLARIVRSKNGRLPYNYIFSPYMIRQHIIAQFCSLCHGISTSSSCQLIFKNDKMAEDVAFIFRSLGGLAIVDKNEVILQASFNSFLPAKLLNRYERQIMDIEYDRKEECQCIYIDSPCHTYLTDNLTITHNTTLARIFANEINHGEGNPIEIDAASNNGVDNVREIIRSANERALQGKYKIFIIDECVSGDTEVLTNEGFKRFDSLNKNELIAQYRDNGAIEFVKPTEYIEREYSGKMYEVKLGEKATILMSPHHVQPVIEDGAVKEDYIEDINFNSKIRFLFAGEGKGESQHLTMEDRIAIALQADGTLQRETKDFNYWTIQVKKDRKKERLAYLLKNSRLRYSEIKSREGCVRYSIWTTKDITKHLSTHFSLDKMSKTYASEFIDELMLWDGYRKNGDKYYYYSSVCKDNVDFAQAVGVLGNFKSRITIEKDDRKETFHDVYRLFLQKEVYGESYYKVQKTAVDFTGKIYCVKVPSHKIIIRKDGLELVTGNCHSLTNQSWQAFLKSLEDTPAYTIYLFCTTAPNKIPETILNRLQRFNIKPVDYKEIYKRLEYVCQQEHFTDYQDTIDMIAKQCKGCVRDALTKLERCAALGSKLNIQVSREILDEVSYESVFKLTWALREKDRNKIFSIVDSIANVKQFVDFYSSFIIDLLKFNIMHDINVTEIPSYLATDVNPVVQSTANDRNFLESLCDLMLSVKQDIKFESSPKELFELYLVRFIGGEKEE